MATVAADPLFVPGCLLRFVDDSQEIILKPPTFEEFAGDARAEGFTDVLERQWAPGTLLESHTHPFALRAIVVEGEMWLSVEGDIRHLRPGDVFALDQGVPHSERYGPEGAALTRASRFCDRSRFGNWTKV